MVCCIKVSLLPAHIRDIDSFTEHLKTLQPTPENTPKRTKYLSRIQNALISAQELGDEKMQIVNQLQEVIDTKTRQLDIDFKNLDYTDDIQQEPLPKMARSSSPTNSNNGVRNDYGAYGSSTTHQRGSTPTSQNSERNSSNGERNFNGKRTRRPRNDMDNDSHSASENSSSVKNNGNNSGGNGLNSSGGVGSIGSTPGSSKNHKNSGQQSSGNGGGSSKKKKQQRKSRQGSGREREESPPPDHIDPDEPTYCLCDQVGLKGVVLRITRRCDLSSR